MGVGRRGDRDNALQVEGGARGGGARGGALSSSPLSPGVQIQLDTQFLSTATFTGIELVVGLTRALDMLL